MDYIWEGKLVQYVNLINLLILLLMHWINILMCMKIPKIILISILMRLCGPLRWRKKLRGIRSRFICFRSILLKIGSWWIDTLRRILWMECVSLIVFWWTPTTSKKSWQLIHHFQHNNSKPNSSLTNKIKNSTINLKLTNKVMHKS